VPLEEALEVVLLLDVLLLDVLPLDVLLLDVLLDPPVPPQAIGYVLVGSGPPGLAPQSYQTLAPSQPQV
jgi:hypothetical protein